MFSYRNFYLSQTTERFFDMAFRCLSSEPIWWCSYCFSDNICKSRRGFPFYLFFLRRFFDRIRCHDCSRTFVVSKCAGRPVPEPGEARIPHRLPADDSTTEEDAVDGLADTVDDRDQTDQTDETEHRAQSTSRGDHNSNLLRRRKLAV